MTLVVIGGPTAAGKTSLAIEVASRLETEIISADSRQFYREMVIGNARPGREELARVAHHFIADRSLTEPLSAGRFAEEAVARLERSMADREHIVVVGGSGLYIRALCEGLDHFPDVTAGARTQVRRIRDTEGLPGLQRKLNELDPAYYRRVDRQNGRRLERALLVSLSGERPYSSYLGQREARPFNCRYFTPAIDRDRLYERIDRRVDRMVEEGLEEEARKLYRHRHLPLLQTVGYQEWWAYFDGERTAERTVELIKRNSRRYAKRQFTWFREYTPVEGASGVLSGLDQSRL